MGKTLATVLGGLGCAMLTAGGILVENYTSAKEGIINAVYLHADKITPELIKEAEKLARDNINNSDGALGILGFTIGAGLLISAYMEARESTSSK